VGRWEGVLESTLVVTKIYAEAKGAHKVDAVYSYGTYSPWYIHAPGYREVSGEIKDGKLTVQRGGIIMTYRLSSDRKALEGTYDNRGKVYPGAFTKTAGQ